MKTNTYTFRPLSIFASLLLSAAPLLAQSTDSASAPNKSSTANPGDKPSSTQGTRSSEPGMEGHDDAIVLTPFEVSTDKDRGYHASNTLSGTRIASKVEDLGASISVITKEQLLDTAALDINDIFRYESNTEGLFDFTAQNSSAPTTDQGQSNPAGANRIRGLSAANVAFDNFVHTARIPIDTYNVSSIEISRGPNSTLFGLGSPAGTINSNLNQAILTREITEVGFRADSYGGYRTTVDLNRPLIKDKLAIRIDGLYSNGAFPQKPSYDLMKRLYAAITYQPFKNTTLRFSAESYHENRQTPNTLTPRDGVTEWIADGKPTWNPLNFTATVNGIQTLPIRAGSGATAENNLYVTPAAGATVAVGLPAGLLPNTTMYTRAPMYIDGGQVRLWEIARLVTGANPNIGSTSDNRLMGGSGSLIQRGLINGGILYNVPGISNQALYDWTSINAVSSNWNSDNAAMYELIFEQKIVENLYFRAGWRLEDSDSYNRNIVNPPTLQIDVNQYLLDGKPNPYFLRPFFSTSEPTIFRSPEYNDALQAYLTYDLNLGEHKGILHWLGHHKMLGYYESRHITNPTFRFREAIDDPNHVWETAGALNYTNGPAINRPTYRYYVGPSGSTGYVNGFQAPKSGVKGTFDFRYNDVASNTWIDDQSSFGDVSYISSQTRQEVTSRGVVLQSDFLNDRIVYTGGLRKDFVRTRNSSGAVVNGITGAFDYGPLQQWGPWTSASGFTRTNSVVVKPLRWFGLSYDKANSFQIQSQAININGELLPNTYGKGQDVGFFVKTPDDKFVLTLKYYKTNIVNDRSADTTLPSRIITIENGTGGGNGFALRTFAQNVALSRGLASGTPEFDNVVFGIMNLPAGTANGINSQIPFRAINNSEGKGAELELSYNPTNNINLKFTGAQTETANTSLAGEISDYIAARMPYWLSVKDDAGNLWWNTSGSGTTPNAYYTTNVSAPLKIDQALLGKSNPQVKKYTWRMIGKYRFISGLLKNLEVGGTAAWNDKSVIGYLGSAPDSDGIVRSLDTNKPVFDPARYTFDFFTTYNFKLMSRIGTRVQLNLQNAFEGGGLRATAVNLDGSVYNWRIINPRKLVLSTTFDF